MPHFTNAVTPIGPLLDCFVGVSIPKANAMQAAGIALPNPVAARFLIDTGASCTVIDPSIVTALGLTPTGTASAHTPSTAGTPHQMLQYDVAIYMIHKNNTTKHFAALPVMAANLKAQNIDGLIGRDVLSECLFIYTGPDSAYMLSF